MVASSNDGTLAEIIAEMTMSNYDYGAEKINDETLLRASTSLTDADGNLKQSVLSTLTEVSMEESKLSSHQVGGKRGSIVGGKPVSQMTYEEQRELMAPERSDRSLLVDVEGMDNNVEHNNGHDVYSVDQSDRSVVSNFPDGGENNENVIVSSTDWPSLTKSCKRAKNAFQDRDSGHTVVKNMFMTHLRPLTAVLTLYAKRCCGDNASLNGKKASLGEIKTRTTETRRALRFAMACLAPPRPDSDDKNAASTEAATAVTQDIVEGYRIERRYRQELQEAAVKGFTFLERSHSLPSLTSSTRSSGTYNNEQYEGETRHHYGLQCPLVQIINDADSSSGRSSSHSLEDEINDPALFVSINRDKQTIRVLAARMLCNLVTDNPLSAEIVLRDVPFSPTPELRDRRMASSILGSREQTERSKASGSSSGRTLRNVIFWSDMISATAKVSEEREELAAVSAALHNLLTSLESREQLLELDDEMKRRRHQIAKMQRAGMNSEEDDSNNHNEEELEEEIMKKPITPMDAGFEIASDGTLLNSLLRNILPTKAVLMQAKLDKERSEPSSRPKFRQPTSAATDESLLSDSATEWISLILERLSSRGLMAKMLNSASGTYMKSSCVTPEQVVLVSCIRHAVDDYHTALTTGETDGFGRRRLSIAAKTAGITTSTRPHPLWGRTHASAGTQSGRDSRTAVPVLLSLANEVESIRLRANALREDISTSIYDGELNCTTRMIRDLVDILAVTLGRHAGSYLNGFETNDNNKQCFIADARSVLGRETSIISDCCKDLGRILDVALALNKGKKAREMELSQDDQQTAIVMVRLLGNIIYQCRYNQDILRITSIPIEEESFDSNSTTSSNATPPPQNTHSEVPFERTGLHVILSATSLAPVCFTLREWCIVAIRNATENNAANIETVRRLEANQVLSDTPELRQMGVKIDLDEHGKVQISRRDKDE